MTHTRSQELPELIVKDAAAWRKWLGSHHEKSRGVWLVVSKKGTTTPTRLTYDQALEEALSHGWIDGQAQGRDDKSYRLRFTPRRSRSAWSKRNTVIADRLISEGRMHAAGTADEHAAAVATMAALNRPAATVLRDFAVHACTDVTGFSLLGHAYEMAHGSDVRVVFRAERLPLLPGARRLAAEGHLTGGCRRNREWLADKVDVAAELPADLVEVAFDPQTSGGLLVALPPTEGGRAVDALAAAGVTAAVVGGVEPHDGRLWVVLR